ncbi:ABC transporter substrate-binding protein [Povalibacter sp.]|uniref:ABC transporter substrate-binding protein n=1 Tax=Povalibacter sp. TaxID=1962978 RepID=UPI002F3ECE07
MTSDYPSRIVCLTEETTETLYLLGEDWRIVGISGFTVRPARARKEKPKVSAFTSAKIDRICELQPDLVLGFSDLQADIAADLVRRGVNVHVFNHRNVAGILSMVRMLGGMVGCQARAEALAADLAAGLERLRVSAARWPVRPRVYFEEWDEPLIAGSTWVSELVEIAGGQECFPQYARHSLGKDRIIADPAEVLAAAPDLIFGSWCGKKFRPEIVRGRVGWYAIPAVASGELHEVKSPLILQPGPAALTDGVQVIHRVIERWHERREHAAASQ